MNRELAVGAVLSAGGVVGYGLGLAVAYPGRAFSVTAAMVGITLLAIGNARRTAATGSGGEP